MKREPVKGSTMALAILAPALYGGAAAFVAIYRWPIYGLVLFFGAPIAIGWISAAILRIAGRVTLNTCLVTSLSAGGVLALGFLLMGWEGMICILLACPLIAPFVALGAWLGWIFLHERYVPAAPLTFLLATLVLVLVPIEAGMHTEVEGVVSDSVIVRAEPRQTWQTIVSLDRVPPPHDWIYRAGIACPQRTRIIKPAVGGLRVCTLSTGVLIEQIDVWQPERMLRWRSLSVPAPMREMNPFHDKVDPPHLNRNFYDSPAGEFALSPIGNGFTTLTRRTWYRHRIYPAWYWNFWCELAIRRIHRTVLDQVRDDAEKKTMHG